MIDNLFSTNSLTLGGSG